MPLVRGRGISERRKEKQNEIDSVAVACTGAVAVVVTATEEWQ